MKGRQSMMIGCLTWGSLVWNPGKLPIRGGWQTDGPFLPIEFARLSNHDRITLVILYDHPEYAPSRSLWTLLDAESPQKALQMLKKREGATSDRAIGLWQKGTAEPQHTVDRLIARWAQAIGLDAVVWTKLGPRWVKGKKTVERMPTKEEILKRIRTWAEPLGTYARLYLQMAPKQIDTPYRRAVFAEFGWFVLSPY
jgi:hypothetical protein